MEPGPKDCLAKGVSDVLQLNFLKLLTNDSMVKLWEDNTRFAIWVIMNGHTHIEPLPLPHILRPKSVLTLELCVRMSTPWWGLKQSAPGSTGHS